MGNRSGKVTKPTEADNNETFTESKPPPKPDVKSKSEVKPWSSHRFRADSIDEEGSPSKKSHPDNRQHKKPQSEQAQSEQPQPEQPQLKEPPSQLRLKHQQSKETKTKESSGEEPSGSKATNRLPATSVVVVDHTYLEFERHYLNDTERPRHAELPGQGSDDRSEWFAVTSIHEIPLAPAPVVLICPFCDRRIETVVLYRPSRRTHMLAAMMFSSLCWPCICLPYCLDCCQVVRHYCPYCKTQIGILNNETRRSSS